MGPKRTERDGLERINQVERQFPPHIGGIVANHLERCGNEEQTQPKNPVLNWTMRISSRSVVVTINLSVEPTQENA